MRLNAIVVNILTLLPDTNLSSKANHSNSHDLKQPSPRITPGSDMQTTQIVNTDTPDPWMIKYRGSYILTFTAGNRIELWRSSLLHQFQDTLVAKRVIW